MKSRLERYNYPEEVELWIKQFRIEEKEVDVEKALKDLFDRQLLHLEQISRFEDRIKKLEELAKRVEGYI